eukprot:NODE_2088_length_1301_cov_9.336262_g1900_i0.p1 GENE.NODE_2088_length_1301_cov_9.336262_g1900_i0~~NODE_2088_length_1301_cov_9.336262_g1900_i0.p1  ORF type:complete len:354 (+),score=64.50 NODE_2088_length_1301_cov_9.336262_g1900_i0:69-1130(+)
MPPVPVTCVIPSVESAEEIEEVAREVQSHMLLYSSSQVQYVLRNAVDKAFARGEELVPDDFFGFDMMHYMGLDGLRAFIQSVPAHVRSGSRILDIGSGFGGPARFLVSEYGAVVVGVELQRCITSACRILSRLLSMDTSKFVAIEGDFLSFGSSVDVPILSAKATVDALPATATVDMTMFDVAISQLVFLHIADKRTLFSRLAESLRPGGVFYIEDFAVIDGGGFTDREGQLLSESVASSPSALSEESKYQALLEEHGLIVDKWEDVTDEWSTFVWQRCENFHAAEQKNRIQYGDQYFADLGTFYRAMAELFHNNKDSGERASLYPLASSAVPPVPRDQPQTLRGVRVTGHRK